MKTTFIHFSTAYRLKIFIFIHEDVIELHHKTTFKEYKANIFSNLACFSFSRHFVICITENESKGSKSVISRGHWCYGNTGKVFANFKVFAILVLFLKIPKI